MSGPLVSSPCPHMQQQRHQCQVAVDASRCAKLVPHRKPFFCEQRDHALHLKVWNTTGCCGLKLPAACSSLRKPPAAQSPTGGTRIAGVGGRIASVSCPRLCHS